MAVLLGAVLALLLVCLLFTIRLYRVVRTASSCGAGTGTRGPVSLLVVAGSGGHTTEILRLVHSLSAAYTPRHYVIADSDRMSEEKICTCESSKQPPHSESQFTICRIPRSREVHQSWSSSLLSCVDALRHALPLVFRLRPDVVSGPRGRVFLSNVFRDDGRPSPTWRRMFVENLVLNHLQTTCFPRCDLLKLHPSEAPPTPPYIGSRLLFEC